MGEHSQTQTNAKNKTHLNRQQKLIGKYTPIPKQTPNAKHNKQQTHTRHNMGNTRQTQTKQQQNTLRSDRQKQTQGGNNNQIQTHLTRKTHLDQTQTTHINNTQQNKQTHNNAWGTP